MGQRASTHTRRYNDLWSFNMTTRYWLEKKTFVYGLYPDTCVNDAFSEWWADQDYWSDDDLNGPSGKFAPINQQRLTDFLIANPLATDGFPAALYVVFMVFFFCTVGWLCHSACGINSQLPALPLLGLIHRTAHVCLRKSKV